VIENRVMQGAEAGRASAPYEVRLLGVNARQAAEGRVHSRVQANWKDGARRGKGKSSLRAMPPCVSAFGGKKG